MANFPVDPERFLPLGLQVQEPWAAEARPARIYVTSQTPMPRRHESCALAILDPRPPAAEIDGLLQQIADHIFAQHQSEVISFSESSVGFGLYRLEDQLHRDLLVESAAVPFGNGRLLSFVRHDEGPNFRASVFTRVGWIMLLSLPMDYRNEDFIRETISKFGKMRTWLREDVSPTRTLVKLAYGGAGDIPRSIVIREAQRYGGTVVSWTVPVFILNNEQGDVLPGDESPEPEDGNPHLLFGPAEVPVPFDNDGNPPLHHHRRMTANKVGDSGRKRMLVTTWLSRIFRSSSRRSRKRRWSFLFP